MNENQQLDKSISRRKSTLKEENKSYTKEQMDEKKFYGEKIDIILADIFNQGEDMSKYMLSSTRDQITKLFKSENIYNDKSKNLIDSFFTKANNLINVKLDQAEMSSKELLSIEEIDKEIFEYHFQKRNEGMDKILKDFENNYEKEKEEYYELLKENYQLESKIAMEKEIQSNIDEFKEIDKDFKLAENYFQNQIDYNDIDNKLDYMLNGVEKIKKNNNK